MAGPYSLFGPFTFDAERATLSRDGRPLDAAGQRALGVLHALLNANGRAVAKAQLIDFAWPDAIVEESNLSVQIAPLRKLLGPAPGGGNWIATIARIGYRFAGSVTVAEAAEELTAESAVDRPSVAVLPFDNLSGEADKECFVDGITEDIIAALSRFRWFFVIGRNGICLQTEETGRGRSGAGCPLCSRGQRAQVRQPHPDFRRAGRRAPRDHTMG